jgi:hypothetical protein
MALALASCAGTGKLTTTGADADFVNGWYKTLYTEAGLIDVAMTAMGTAYKEGKFSEANKASATVAHTAFKTAWDAAIPKLIEYYNTPTEATKSAANLACIQVQTTAAAVTAISVLQSTQDKAVK